MKTKTKKHPLPVALVTGASRGLGREIALALARTGYTVVVNYHSSVEAAEEVAEKAGRGSLALEADVGDYRQVLIMASAIDHAFGRLEAVINNAGIARDNLLLRQSAGQWDEVIRTNLKGCFNVIRAAVPLMIKSGGGHILNISSYSGLKGKAGQTAYSASKAAILGLSRTAALELSGYNINVNVLLPGYMMTDMGMKAGKAMETAREASISGRLSRPEEVADFVAGVIRLENVTGQVFSLDTRII